MHDQKSASPLGPRLMALVGAAHGCLPPEADARPPSCRATWPAFGSTRLEGEAALRSAGSHAKKERDRPSKSSRQLPCRRSDASRGGRLLRGADRLLLQERAGLSGAVSADGLPCYDCGTPVDPGFDRGYLLDEEHVLCFNAASAEVVDTPPTKTAGSPSRKSMTSQTSSSPTPSSAAHRVPLICLAAFSLAWMWAAVMPNDRATWLLENLPTAVIVPLLIATYRRFQFSNRTYVQGLVFLVLHTIGSHFTYSLVPLGAWAQEALELSRNHYDRFVHFSFGLLAFAAAREGVFRRSRMSRFAQLSLTFCVIATLSLAYELLEWWVAVLVDPAAGSAFLGTQGDQWDAQKDMGLACLGALPAAAYEYRALSVE